MTTPAAMPGGLLPAWGFAACMGVPAARCMLRTDPPSPFLPGAGGEAAGPGAEVVIVEEEEEEGAEDEQEATAEEETGGEDAMATQES